jgi:hypothetical protein
MTENMTIILIITIVVLLIGIGYMLFSRRKTVQQPQNVAQSAIDPATRQLQLQAYERLVLLAERISLTNLIGKLYVPGCSAHEMQMLLVQQTRQEFDHNVTQQIYVSAEAWEAVRKLKEQNLLTINQVAASLPPNATGMDLNKRILEFIMNDPKGNLQPLVLEALNIEAKKIMV